MKNSINKLLIGLVFIALSFNAQTAFGKLIFQTEYPSAFILDDDSGFGVTMKAYKRIKIGMSLREVCRIIGNDGDEMTRSNGGGNTFTSHKWEGSDYAIITAVFKNQILTNKYEANLK